jgi:hypothetical protein
MATDTNEISNDIVYISDVFTEDKIKSLNRGEPILIKSQTGSGKTYWCLNALCKYAKENNLKVALLVNRDNLKHQIEEEVKSNVIIIKDTIKIFTYQAIQESHSKNPLADFDFIVCDEFHYIFSDCEFNNKTDIMLSYLMSIQQHKFLIIMSATAMSIRYYFKAKLNVDMELLDVDSNNKDIRYYIWNNDETIQQVLHNIQDNEKVLYFGNKSEKLMELKNMYDNSCFIVSKYSKLKGNINKEEIDNIITNEKFNSKYCFATKALDNGINIKDDELRHIVIDNIIDSDTIIQMIGRKRFNALDENEYLNVYLRIPNKQLLGHTMQVIKSDKQEIEELIKDEKEYDKKKIKYKSNRKRSDIIYYGGEGKWIINSVLQVKNLVIELMLNMFKDDNDRYSDDKILKEYARRMNLNVDSFINLETLKDNKKNEIVGIYCKENKDKLLSSDEVKTFFKSVTDRPTLMNINNTIKQFKYEIVSIKKSKREGSKVKKITYWKLQELK